MRLACLLALILLTGCQTVLTRAAGPGNAEAWNERREWLASLDQWTLEGRAAIAAYDEGWNANVFWQQQNEKMDVRFSGPLGMGSAAISGTPQVLTVETAEGETFTTTDPETDLYWHLGWTAPLDRMRYWVLGLPGPGPVLKQELDGAGRLIRLQQGGWTVDYADFLALPGGKSLPRKLEMRRDGVRIRLVVSGWELSEPAAR